MKVTAKDYRELLDARDRFVRQIVWLEARRDKDRRFVRELNRPGPPHSSTVA